MAIELLSYGLLKDVVLHVWRRVRPQAAKAAVPQARPTIISVPVSTCGAGFTVRFGDRAVILDQGVVQETLRPGRYRRRRLAALRRKQTLSSQALLLRWPAHPVDVPLVLTDLPAADGHLFTATVTLRIRLRRQPAGTALDVDRTDFEDALRSAVRSALEARLALESGDAVYPGQWKGSEHRHRLAQALNGSVMPEWIDEVRVDALTLSNPQFDEIHSARRTTAFEQQRIDELRTQSRLVSEVRIANVRSATVLAGELRRRFVESPASPFTAQQRQQIGRHLELIAAGASSDDVVEALRKGAESGMRFDPFRLERGPRTLRPASHWSGFDGESLWQVQLTRIHEQWRLPFSRRERVGELVFEISGQPGDRKITHHVRPQCETPLPVGEWEIPIRFISGNATQVTIELGAAARRVR